jgi:hypothetical protein
MAGKPDHEIERTLALAVKQVLQPSEFEALGRVMEKARKHLTSANIANYLHQCTLANLTDLQRMVSVFIVPLELAPREMFTHYRKLLRTLKFHPPAVQNAFALRTVRVAVLSDRVQELYTSKAIQELYQSDDRVFQRALLYLTAHTSHPIVMNPILIGIPRADATLLYYSAVNKLLARSIDAADNELQQAWELSRAAKEVRFPIVHVMSLTAFLTGVSWELFAKRLSEKYVPIRGPPRTIWCLDGKLNMGEFSGLYDRFSAEIVQAHARRLIVDLSNTVSVAPVVMVDRWCATKQWESEAEEGAVSVNDGIVRFRKQSLGSQIDAEMAIQRRSIASFEAEITKVD